MAITYAPQNGRLVHGERMWGIDVRLDGKLVGDIRPCDGGWQYKPTGRKPGETFPDVVSVKRSLEAP